MVNVKHLLNEKTFSNTSAFVGLVLASIALFGLTSNEITAVIWVYGAYIFILAFLLVLREYTYSRKARYAESIKLIHQVSHKLRDGYDMLENHESQSCSDALRDALSSFSTAFSIITGTSCRASIKTIAKNNDIFYAQDMCNSNNGFEGSGRKHPISENTDFKKLFNHSYNYFFSNNLKTESPYENSNWPDVDSKRKSFLKDKRNDYNATIVWPIRGKTTEEKPKILGFLCIDSQSKGAFNRRYDIDFGAVVADTLYSFLLRFQEFKKGDKADG